MSRVAYLGRPILQSPIERLPQPPLFYNNLVYENQKEQKLHICKNEKLVVIMAPLLSASALSALEAH